MPAIHGNTDAQQSCNATQWKNEIREFCQQIQTDIRVALSVVDQDQDAVSQNNDIPESSSDYRTTQETSQTFEAASSVDSDDIQDPAGSTEDRLRKLREQLNNLIDEEDV